MDQIRSLDAADWLGVSDRQVRHLVVRGELESPRRGWITAASLDAYAARRGSVLARVWEPRTAWAALELMTGGNAEWLGSSQRSRLRRSLIGRHADEVVSRLRNRADVRCYAVDADLIPEVAAGLVVTRDDQESVEGYVAERALHGIISEQRMVRSDEGNVRAHVLGDEIGQDFVEVVAAQGPVLAGVDLAGSTDEVERERGRSIVEQALLALA